MEFTNITSITDYFDAINNFEVNLNKEKYSLILKFINFWLKFEGKNKFKSLLKFRNLSEKNLLYDLKHNRYALRKFSKQIKSKLNIKFNIDDETDSDEIKDKYILYFLSRCLVSIGYRLKCLNIDDKNYYSIVNNYENN